MHALLDAHFAGATTAHWLELLDAHDVWCAPVQDHAQLERDPQVAHAGLVWEVPVGDDPDATFRTIGSPFSFSATPATLRSGVPRAGQHTEAVLGAVEPA